MASSDLHRAKRAKNDEFYTQLHDIEQEVSAYLEYDENVFRGKTVLLPCDDPYSSNFFKYFAIKFNPFGLARLIATSYLKGSGNKAYIFDTTQILTMNNDDHINLDDTILLMKTVKEMTRPLEGNGDFRSAECVELLKQADIVVTNPPFSLFREFVSLLVEHNKKFLIIGNKNAITYKEIFKLIKENKLWTGRMPMGTDMLFDIPEKHVQDFVKNKTQGSAYRIVDGKVKGRSQACWFTNIDHGRRHESLSLMTTAKNLKHSKHKEIRGQGYAHYDNYDAIEVPYTDAIPGDYEGVMGVPISFLDKYNPDQFEILGNSNVRGEREHLMTNHDAPTDCTYINGKPQYARIFIKRRTT